MAFGRTLDTEDSARIREILADPQGVTLVQFFPHPDGFAQYHQLEYFRPGSKGSVVLNADDPKFDAVFEIMLEHDYPAEFNDKFFVELTPEPAPNGFKIDVDGSPVFYDTEHAMREDAGRIARFNEHSVTLYRLVEAGTWEQIALVEWDGVPTSNETLEVEATFSATIKVRVRKYDHYGKERDLREALQFSVSDALNEELGYEQPEEHDFIERAMEHATYAEFGITSVSSVETATA